LHELRRQKVEGQLDLLPTKERQSTMAALEKLETNLGGLADTRRLPDAMVVIDLKKEALAVREARRLGITVIGLVDTNCDPDDADFIIPGNDDAIRSTGLIVRVLANAIAEGQAKVRPAEFEASENGEPSEPGEPGQETEAAAEAPAEPPAAAEQEPTPAAAVEAPPAEVAPAAAEPATAPAEEPAPVPEAVPEPPVAAATAEELQPVAEAASTEEAPVNKDEKSE
jgi:small subunit ribosomal protein S2